MRIIVDTNLWISILIKHRLRKLTAGLSGTKYNRVKKQIIQ